VCSCGVSMSAFIYLCVCVGVWYMCLFVYCNLVWCGCLCLFCVLYIGVCLLCLCVSVCVCGV